MTSIIVSCELFKKLIHFTFSIDKIVSDKKLQWLDCCNDTFLPRQVWDLIPMMYTKCLNETGDPKTACFHTCFLKSIGMYSTNGVNKKLVKRMIGSNAMLGDPTDWKKVNADKIIDECLNNIDSKAYNECSEDVKNFGTCYFYGLFKACPDLNEMC